MIFGKNYRDIEFEDIERLVNNKISESRTLDYKKEISIEKGEDRKEFLYDICSFVNTEGGVIIYGISELKDEEQRNTGIPEAICGIKDNFDKLIQKIEDLIKTSIEPNIFNITIKHLSKDNKNILFIGLPKSLGLPRMVTYNSTNKFYRRRNSGKYLVDIYELNQMFMESFETFKSLEEFRTNRLNKIRKGEYISNVNPRNLTLLHISPISFFQFNQLSLTELGIQESIHTVLKPMTRGGWESRYNFEGLLIFNYDNERDEITAYNQIFRNGIIEFCTHLFHEKLDENILYLGWLELQIIESVNKALQLYKTLDVSPPFVVHLTITDLLNRKIDPPKTIHLINTRPFITNDLLIPNIVINDFDENIEKKLSTIFNIIWQSAGCRKSPHFNDIGERIK